MRTRLWMLSMMLGVAWPALADGVQFGAEHVFEPAVTSAQQDTNTNPRTAAGGGVVLSAWSDSRRYRSEIYASRVDANGALLDEPNIAVALTQDSFHNLQLLDLAFDGTDFWVLFYDGEDNVPRVQRVSTAGLLVGAQQKLTAMYGSAHLGCTGGTCLVAWYDQFASTKAIRAQRVTAQGIVDSTPLTLSTDLSAPYTPVVLGDAAGFLVAWQDSASGHSHVNGLRVSSQGQPGTVRQLSFSKDASAPALATAQNGQTFVTWYSGGAASSSTLRWITGTRLNALWEPLDSPPVYIQNTPGLIDAYSLIPFGTGFLASWTQRDATTDPQTGSIQGLRFDTAGAKVDQSPLSFRSGNGAAISLCLAPLGSGALAVWETYRSDLVNFSDYRSIFAGRLSSTLAPTDGAGFPISTEPNWQESPHIAGSGAHLVVWADTRGSAPANIYGARVDGSGTALAAPFVLAASTGTQAHPSVAFDGTNYLVTWDERPGAHARSVKGVRVSQTGSVLDTTPIVIAASTTGSHDAEVAFGGGVYLVAYEDDTFSSTLVRARRVDTSGHVMDTNELVLTTATQRQDEVAVGSNGTDFLVTWSDDRLGISAQIYGTRVTAQGAVQDPAGLYLSGRAKVDNTGENDTGPRVVFVDPNYVVAFNAEFSGPVMTRVALDGGSLDVPPIDISATLSQDYPNIGLATDGTRTFALWESWTAGLNGAALAGTSSAALPSLTSGATPAISLDTDGHGFVVYTVIEPGTSHVPRLRAREIVTCAGACDGGTADAGTDAGADAGGDAGADAGDAGADAGADAGVDAGSDAGTDAGADAGADAGGDGGTGADAGSDAGTSADAGADAGAHDAGSHDAGNETPADVSGCGCTSADPASFAGFFGLLALAWRRRAHVR